MLETCEAYQKTFFTCSTSHMATLSMFTILIFEISCISDSTFFAFLNFRTFELSSFSNFPIVPKFSNFALFEFRAVQIVNLTNSTFSHFQIFKFVNIWIYKFSDSHISKNVQLFGFLIFEFLKCLKF